MGELAYFPLTPSDNKRVIVCSVDEIMGLSASVTHITVLPNCDGVDSTSVVDMSRFMFLRRFVVGDGSFTSLSLVMSCMGH